MQNNAIESLREKLMYAYRPIHHLFFFPKIYSSWTMMSFPAMTINFQVISTFFRKEMIEFRRGANLNATPQLIYINTSPEEYFKVV